MSQYVWAEVRERAIDLYRNTPSGPIEQRVIDVFREHPAMVVEAVAHVGARFEAGKIRSPWVILAKHVEQAVTPLENAVVTDERDRDRAISRAGQWARAAGKHFDHEPEVLDALFGNLGQLRYWHGDEQLRKRMVELWREVRAEGELIERQAEERAAHWKELHALISRRKESEAVDPDDEDDGRGPGTGTTSSKGSLDDDDIPF